MTDFKQTIGEYRVGISFNPSGNPLVDEIKRKAADLIDLINTIDTTSESLEFSHWAEISSSKVQAMHDVEMAAMWAVKAATKPERE